METNNRRTRGRDIVVRTSKARLTLFLAALSILFLLTPGSSSVSSGQALQGAGVPCVLEGPSRCDSPRLYVEKHGPAAARPGETLTYTIHYRVEKGRAAGVVITDTLPEHAGGATASLPYRRSGNDLIWEIGALAPQAEGTIVVAVTVNRSLADGLALRNAVQADCRGCSPAHDAVTTTVTAPVLQVTQAVHPEAVEPGQELRYTISIANAGSAPATGVVVTDVLPAHVTCRPAAGDRFIAPHTLAWTAPDLDPGGRVSRTIAVTVARPLTDGLALRNVAQAGCHEGSWASAAATATVDSWLQLSVVKVPPPGPVEPGDTLTYTIVYGVAGTDMATHVQITDVLPLSLTYRSASVPPAIAPTGAAHHVVWRFARLDPPVEGLIVLTATATAPLRDGMHLVNRVEMRSDRAEAARYTTATPCASARIYLPLVLQVYPFLAFCNGGFEEDFACWAHGGELAQRVACAAGVAYAGSCAARLGSVHPYEANCAGGVPTGQAWMSQTFTVPTCDSPALSFQYRVTSYQKKVGADTADRFDVRLNGQRIWHYSGQSPDPNWGQDHNPCQGAPWETGWQGDFPPYDLSGYRGQHVTLSFHNMSGDPWFNTVVYVDHVEVRCE